MDFRHPFTCKCAFLKKIFSSFEQIFVGFVVKEPCSPIEEQSRRERERERERERAMETEKLTHILTPDFRHPFTCKCAFLKKSLVPLRKSSWALW
jgi:hypothetical protein